MVGFRKKYSEIRISGRTAVASEAAVLGRVKFFDESYTEGSILCIRGEEQIEREMLLLCPPIAILAFCNESAALLGEICSIGVPCLVFDEVDVKFEMCKNKVALVDTERGILLLDPSIDTLETYLSKGKKRLFSLDCPIGKILNDVNAEQKSLGVAEHYVADISLLGENDVFDSAVSLWEQFCPEVLLLEISVPTEADITERAFCERIEEIYRAALYGSFAISLYGFDTENELARALRLLHKTFCILEAEGREFNSYLPRGITLSSPLWLMRSSPVTNPDFLIFDLDRLLPSIFSLSVDEIKRKEKVLREELFLLLERYFMNFAPRCDIYLKTKQFCDIAFLRDLVRLTNAKAVFS